MSKNGETILAERSKQRVTQNELARRLGLMTSTIVDIEYNRIGIDEETFQRIMDALNKDCTH
jgi:transcriptional regulator with XRE-family HTH domain